MGSRVTIPLLSAIACSMRQGVAPRRVAGKFLTASVVTLTLLTLGSLSAGAQNAARKEVSSARGLLASLKEALSQGEKPKAREVLAKLLTQHGLDSQVLLEAGLGLAQQELYAEASQAFARCVRDYPELFEGYYNLALAQLALRKYPESLATLEEAPRASQAEENARLYLRGKIEAEMGRTRQAERDLAAAFAAAPQEENYALDLGLLYLRQRDYVKAIDVFQRGTTSQGGSVFLLLGLSLAQFLGGKNADSLQTCERILRLQPDFSPARILLAFALYMDGEFEEAARIAGAGLSTPDPSPYLYYLHAAILLKLQSKEYAGMLEDLARAERAIPSCSLCCLTESKIHQQMGNLNASAADLEKAVRLDPTYPDAWYRLASLYDRLGRYDEAKQARTRFRELKEERTNRETEILRHGFLEALGGEETPRDSQ